MITNKKSHILSLYDVWKLRYGMLGRRDVPQKREDHSSSTVICVPNISQLRLQVLIDLDIHLDNITEHYGYTIICQDVTTLRKRAKKRDVPQIPLNVFGGLKPRYRYDTIKEIDCYVKYTH